MAQKQYSTFQTDILSFELRDALVGFVKPGRYMGFDGISYGTQVVNDIPITIYCDEGINKYNQQIPPVFEAQRSLIITNQGTIISDDGDINLTLTLRANANGGIHLIYMRHAYDGVVVGANPATYHIVSQDKTSGQPALPTTADVIIGLIVEEINATGAQHLTYHKYHPGVGDQGLMTLLFGDDNGFDTYGIGSMVGMDSIIGSRDMVSPHYLSASKSITDLLVEIDDQMYIEDVARVAIGNRALDDSSWGALTDITNHNVSTGAHGLMPILSGDADEYLGGTGIWGRPIGKQIKWRSSIPAGTDFDYNIGTGGVQNFDLSTIVTDSDSDLVLIETYGATAVASVTGSQWSFYAQGGASSGGSFIELRPDLNNSSGTGHSTRTELWVKMDSSRRISINRIAGVDGATGFLGFRIKGWQTANA